MNLVLLGDAVGEGTTVMFHGKDGHWRTMEDMGGIVRDCSVRSSVETSEAGMDPTIQPELERTDCATSSLETERHVNDRVPISAATEYIWW